MSDHQIIHLGDLARIESMVETIIYRRDPDFDDIVQHVRLRLIQGKYNPAKGELQAWVRTTAKRWKIGIYRKQSSFSKLCPTLGVMTARRYFLVEQTFVNDPVRLSPNDKGIITGWKERKRLVLLVVPNLLGILSEHDQLELVAHDALAAFHQACLGDLCKRSRIVWLEENFDINPATITKIWNRGKRELQNLELIKKIQNNL
ncbi:MAG: hypothetical protein R3B84_14050 [Zavarzinella sp.]